jgi:3-phosphoshikimate 1-carboxyvinyltransferase
MIVHGKGRLHGGSTDSAGDHRLAMTLAVAGLLADGRTGVGAAESVEISYPGFWADLERLRPAREREV